MTPSLLTGFGISLGLIVAIGAQNAWVLNKSMRREYPWVVAAICASIDATLITLGVYSIESLQQRLPTLVPVMTWLGIALLCWLGGQAFRRAWQGSSGLLTSQQRGAQSGWQIAGQAAAISLLNPHVYLDTVVLIGSVGVQQANTTAFVIGASSASLLWFFSLAGFGHFLGPKLQSPRAWRIFDTLIGIIMLLVAFSLAPTATG